MSGRKLKVGTWDNPSGDYFVGIKKSTDIFPKDFALEKDDKETFDASTKELLATLIAKKTTLGKEDAELDTQIELLKGSTFSDDGFMIDCVAFKDSEGNFRGVVDCTKDGDLTQYEPLADYALERKQGRFSDKTMFNYGIKFYEDGKIMSIVTGGRHGTHVASIASGYHPKQPELNGVAPGAQIISMKIGDNRLGTMETGVGILRAITASKVHKVDLINMSYGEPSSTPTHGRIVSLLSELVRLIPLYHSHSD